MRGLPPVSSHLDIKVIMPDSCENTRIDTGAQRVCREFSDCLRNQVMQFEKDATPPEEAIRCLMVSVPVLIHQVWVISKLASTNPDYGERDDLRMMLGHIYNMVMKIDDEIGCTSDKV